MNRTAIFKDNFLCKSQICEKKLVYYKLSKKFKWLQNYDKSTIFEENINSDEETDLICKFLDF